MKYQKEQSRRNTEEGYTLMEVLVSLGLFTIISAGMVPSFVTYMKHNTNSQVKTEAIAVGQQILDRKRALEPSDMPTSGYDTPTTINVGKRSYEVKISYCTRSIFCSTGTRHLTAEVTYNNDLVYSTETVFTELR